MGRVIAILVLLSSVYVGYFVNRKVWFPPSLPPLRDGYFGAGQKRTDDGNIEKFTVSVTDEQMDDLRNRLENSRTYESLEGAKFRYGINGLAVEKIKRYWLDQYSWKKHQDIINKFDHFKTEIEGLKVHFIRAKPKSASKYKRVVPLLLVHGWPGSVFEFYKMIPLLTDPQSTDVAFEVIAPSIPGYGWSDKPKKQGFGPSAAARVFAKLMDRLGHKTYMCQGGDWGSFITTIISQSYPERVIGLHLNMAVVEAWYSPVLFVRVMLGNILPFVSVDDADYHKVYPMGEKFMYLMQESGYMHIQGTKPDTVGVALNDSPIGLASYILEKFASWVNKAYVDLEDGGLTRHFTMDELLTNIMIYWTTQTIASSQRFYKECFASEDYMVYNSAPVTVPTAVACFPQEIAVNPRNHLEYKYTNLTRYTDMPRGGHFAAFEEPKILAADIIAFAKELIN